MHIDRIDIVHVAMPLVYPFRTAYGEDWSVEGVLVRLCSGGLYGWGEATPLAAPAYSPEAALTQFVVAREFVAPRLLGQDIPSGDDLQAQLACIKGNYFAKAAFDLAWWDLHAKERGEPLWRLLGGERTTVEAGADFGVLDSIDDLVAVVGTALEQGYPRVKLKFRPGWELDMLSSVREAYPNARLHVDCNSAYTLDDLAMLRELDRFGLAMIEQPLAHDDLIDHAALQKELATPVCLDESITSPAKARKAAQIGACGWVNVKPGRVGGLTQAKAVHDVCRAAGLPCWVGGMLESAVGAHHCLALATLPNMRYPSDLFPSTRFYARDLGAPSMHHSAPGQFKVPDVPGAGCEPEPEMLAQCTKQRATLSA